MIILRFLNFQIWIVLSLSGFPSKQIFFITTIQIYVCFTKKIFRLIESIEQYSHQKMISWLNLVTLEGGYVKTNFLLRKKHHYLLLWITYVLWWVTCKDFSFWKKKNKLKTSRWKMNITKFYFFHSIAWGKKRQLSKRTPWTKFLFFHFIK